MIANGTQCYKKCINVRAAAASERFYDRVYAKNSIGYLFPVP